MDGDERATIDLTAPIAAIDAFQPRETEESSEWVLVYDAKNQRDYYYNLETEESLWEPPEGFEDCTFRRYEEPQQSQVDKGRVTAEGHETEQKGWHYIDMNGQTQGPFAVEQLHQWRGHFPMNAQFWTTQQLQNTTDEQRKSQKSTLFAQILGDEALLQKWQQETPNHEHLAAPPAPVYAYYLEHPPELAPLPEPQPQAEVPSSEQAYADAVLAGLPPEDETVQLADLAKQSGTSLKDIARFVDSALSDGTTAQQLIVTDPHSGKMTAVSTEPDESHNLYGEFGSWIDPSKMAQGLEKSAKYRREKLPSLWMKQVGYKKRKLPWEDERYDRDN